MSSKPSAFSRVKVYGHLEVLLAKKHNFAQSNGVFK